MDLTYTGYKGKMLKMADKLVRYKNHIAFITTYLKAKKIPKGFKLKFHTNMDLDVDHILHKCSTKIMKRTATFYRTKAKHIHATIKTMDEKVRLHFPELHPRLIDQIATKADRINNQMAEAQRKKLTRDEMYVTKAIRSIKELKKKLDEELSEIIREPMNENANEGDAREELEAIFNNSTNESFHGFPEEDAIEGDANDTDMNRNHTTEDLTRGINIPSREPILLTNNPKFQEPMFKTLLSKGPSFVPTPSSADWEQLQQDYDRFANSLRRKIFFHNSEQTLEEQPTTDAPRKPSNWKAPRSNIPEAEIFLKQIEK